MKWTADLVKEELPNIRVKFADGTELDASLTGRYRKHPEISVKVHGSWLSTSATWETIAHTLNEHRPLSI